MHIRAGRQVSMPLMMSVNEIKQITVDFGYAAIAASGIHNYLEHRSRSFHH
jgi:hypothetical protein